MDKSICIGIGEMNRLQRFFTDYCEFLISRFRFEIVFQEFTDSFGGNGCIIVSNGIMSVQIILEREGYAFGFHNNKEKKYRYYDLDIIKNFIENPDKYQLKKEVTFENSYDTEFQFARAVKNINYIEQNIDKIIQIFSDANFKSTTESLQKLLKVRSKMIFG